MCVLSTLSNLINRITLHIRLVVGWHAHLLWKSILLDDEWEQNHILVAHTGSYNSFYFGKETRWLFDKSGYIVFLPFFGGIKFNFLARRSIWFSFCTSLGCSCQNWDHLYQQRHASTGTGKLLSFKKKGTLNLLPGSSRSLTLHSATHYFYSLNLHKKKTKQNTNLLRTSCVLASTI